MIISMEYPDQWYKKTPGFSPWFSQEIMRVIRILRAIKVVRLVGAVRFTQDLQHFGVWRMGHGGFEDGHGWNNG